MDPQLYGPLSDAIVYYLTVIVVCEGARYLADRVFDKKSTIHTLAIEFLGTLQITTTVYENAVIDIYLGRQAFAITLFTMGLIFALCVRDASIGPLAPFEQFLFGKIGLSKLVQILSAQILAGFLAFRFARFIWLTTAYQLSDAHSNVLGIFENCGFNHPFNVYIHLLIEIVGTFIVRHVLTRATSESRDSRVRFIFPAFFMAAVFTGTVTYLGDQALDPMVASTLFFGCRGLDFQHFILIYWIAPSLGWLASAYWDSLGEQSARKRANKEKKKQQKRDKKSD